MCGILTPIGSAVPMIRCFKPDGARWAPHENTIPKFCKDLISHSGTVPFFFICVIFSGRYTDTSIQIRRAASQHLASAEVAMAAEFRCSWGSQCLAAPNIRSGLFLIPFAIP